MLINLLIFILVMVVIIIVLEQLVPLPQPWLMLVRLVLAVIFIVGVLQIAGYMPARFGSLLH